MPEQADGRQPASRLTEGPYSLPDADERLFMTAGPALGVFVLIVVLYFGPARLSRRRPPVRIAQAGRAA